MPKIDAPTVVEHRAMRERAVVDNAVTLLVEHGPAALTPAAVAKMTGIARTSVYQYFPTAAELLGAAIERLLQESLAEVERALAAAGDVPADRIDAYVRCTLQSAAEGHHPTRVAGLELPPEWRARLRTLHDEIAAPLARIVQASGAADVAVGTALAQGAISGAVQLVEHGAPIPETAAATVSFLQRALGLDDLPSR